MGLLHGLYAGVGGNEQRPVAVDADGKLIVSGATGGTGGDASAANQASQIALETAIRDRLPATAHSQPLTDAQLRASSFPVDVVLRGAATDRSGTITAGGTAQQIAASNAARKLLTIQNLSSTADLWFRTDGTATAGPGSIRVQPGQLLMLDAAGVFTGAVSIFSSVTGHPFTCKEI